VCRPIHPPLGHIASILSEARGALAWAPKSDSRHLPTTRSRLLAAASCLLLASPLSRQAAADDHSTCSHSTTPPLWHFTAIHATQRRQLRLPIPARGADRWASFNSRKPPPPPGGRGKHQYAFLSDSSRVAPGGGAPALRLPLLCAGVAATAVALAHNEADDLNASATRYESAAMTLAACPAWCSMKYQ
jgi:hypothetical protein